jgi:hypothetical protein
MVQDDGVGVVRLIWNDTSRIASSRDGSTRHVVGGPDGRTRHVDPRSTR